VETNAADEETEASPDRSAILELTPLLSLDLVPARA